MQAPVLVLNTNTKRQTGREAQLQNIESAKAVADIVRTCLGPRAMLKMILSQIGTIILTNDGNAILRELDVSHPAAKSMIELSRTQDEEVGDGTTSVIILAGEMLTVAEPWIKKGMYPTLVIKGFMMALQDAQKHLESISFNVDLENSEEVATIIKSAIGTKFMKKWNDMMVKLTIDAVKTVTIEDEGAGKDIDIKRYVRVEKIPGAEITDSEVIHGVVLNKDVTHAKMRRRIENPRVILLDCGLEYKKGENMLNLELMNEADFEKVLKQEEEAVKKMVDDILKFKPDLVCTEKALDDLAQHYFVKAGVTALRRMKKTDANRLARATGATIVHRTDEIKESDVGTKCGLYEVRKIGDEYFSFIEQCRDAKACTILLRGASKDVLNEVERNLQDALMVARNVALDPKLVPGGGASEMSVAHFLLEKSKSVEGVLQWPYRSVGIAMEVIPRTLAQNCGAKTVRQITALRAKHAQDPAKYAVWGINGETGELADMKELGIWDPLEVKMQTIKTSIEAACMLLRVDDIVSGISKKGGGGGGGGGPPGGGMPDPSMMAEMDG